VLSGYKLTEMEKKIEKLYKENGILTPSDLSIQNLSNVFNVKVDLSINGSKQEQRAIWTDDLTVIFLDPDQPEEKQREVFFHEFGHPLLHIGNQMKMKNKTFRDLQEAQANQFQLYAAIPFFMLQELELPEYENQIIHIIKSVFKVTEALARKRLEQIKRRILQSKMDTSFYFQEVVAKKETDETMETYPMLEDFFSPQEIKNYFAPRQKTKSIVYFDYQNEKPVPLRYCIEFSPGEVNWGKDFKLFAIDSDFELVHLKEFSSKEADAPVSELFLHPSHPNDFAIDLKVLRKKLKFFDVDPYNINRFIINANQLESLLELNIFRSRLLQIGRVLTNN
jgi:Zn-dependent peptidase ImmA (M78 family)